MNSRKAYFIAFFMFQETIPENEQKSNKNSKNYAIVYNASEESGTPHSERKNETAKLLHNMSSGLGTTNSSKGGYYLTFVQVSAKLTTFCLDN